MLVAGEETKESLSTWPSAAVAQQSSGSERVARERQEEGRRRREADGRGSKTAEKENGRGFVFFLFFFSPI